MEPEEIRNAGTKAAEAFHAFGDALREVDAQPLPGPKPPIVKPLPEWPRRTR